MKKHKILVAQPNKWSSFPHFPTCIQSALLVVVAKVKKGKETSLGAPPGRRERMALFLLVRAFLAQLHQRGSQSMGFLSGTAVFQVYGWPPFQTRTSLRSGAGAATSTWKPPHPPQSSAPCQQFPLAVCRDSWGKAEWLLGWG